MSENPAEHLKPYQFKPGQSGNPAGRPPEAPAALKNYTKKEIAEVLCRMMKMTVDELVRFSKHPEATALEVIISSVIRECMKKGDFWALDKMLERVIGKVPLKQELTGADGAPFQPPRLVVRRIAKTPESAPVSTPVPLSPPPQPPTTPEAK